MAFLNPAVENIIEPAIPQETNPKPIHKIIEEEFRNYEFPHTYRIGTFETSKAEILIRDKLSSSPKKPRSRIPEDFDGLVAEEFEVYKLNL